MDESTAERLTTQAEAASRISGDIRSVYTSALDQQAKDEQAQDAKYLSLVPTFLSMHQQADASKQLLDSLEAFLSTFQADLSTLSSHISALQTTSQGIDSRLEARRQIEGELAMFLSEISLSPRVVELFFDTEPESRVELWQKAVRQLERVIEATKRNGVAAASVASLENGNGAAEIQAIKEAREVAEMCKNVVTTKLRTYLISPYALIRTSVTTNLQVLQTSILLKHHRPLYAFLARQMPRVAIDVQRSYVASARLYFETAFRRYSRLLGLIKSRWVESAGGPITEASSASSSAAAMAFLSRPASSQAADGAESDPWNLELSRLEHARLDGPGTVLGYMADDPAYKAGPESLFRSLSLVMVDNACSEYTFLVRFFENLQGSEPAEAQALSNGAGEESTPTIPEEEEAEASVVQLSRLEQAQMRGRGASDEIWKQVFEPALNTWSTFAKGLLTPAPPLLSLLSMLRLNDALISLVNARGCSTPLLASALMGFKIQAFPLLKRGIDEQVQAVRKAGAAKSEGVMQGMFRVATGASTTALTDESLRMVCARYANLVSRMAYMLDEDDDEGLFASLARLRAEIEKLLSRVEPKTLAAIYNLILQALETGPAATSQPRMQAELSHWNEMDRLRRSM